MVHSHWSSLVGSIRKGAGAMPTLLGAEWWVAPTLRMFICGSGLHPMLGHWGAEHAEELCRRVQRRVGVDSVLAPTDRAEGRIAGDCPGLTDFCPLGDQPPKLTQARKSNLHLYLRCGLPSRHGRGSESTSTSVSPAAAPTGRLGLTGIHPPAVPRRSVFRRSVSSKIDRCGDNQRES